MPSSACSPHRRPLHSFPTRRSSDLSERITITPMSPQEIIDYGIELGIVERHDHQLGSIIRTDSNRAVLMTYFRNNTSHLLAVSAWVACCFLNTQRLTGTRLKALATTA